jgi:hypothetical protein
MNTAYGVYCSMKGNFLPAHIDEAMLASEASKILPNYTIPVVLVHDPLKAMRSTAKYGYGRIMLSSFRNSQYGGTTFVHEMGHSFGGLGDEYSDPCGAVIYKGSEPPEPNLTIQTDVSKVKWRRFIKGVPPVPTPMGYNGYGLFEGCIYGTKGVYRPSAISMMRSSSYPFGKVNEKHLKALLNKFRK